MVYIYQGNIWLQLFSEQLVRAIQITINYNYQVNNELQLSNKYKLLKQANVQLNTIIQLPIGWN